MRLAFRLCVLVIPVLLSSCDLIGEIDGGREGHPLSEQNILDAVYGGERFSENFFQEENVREIDPYYLGDNVRVGSDQDLVYRQQCANTIQEANQLIGSLAEELSEGQHTDKHFEFLGSEEEEENHNAGVLRVHRCSYFEGVEYDGVSMEYKSNDWWFGVIEQIYPLKKRPVTAKSVQELVQRLWFYRHYKTSGAFVLKQSTQEKSATVIYTQYEGRTSFGDRDLCDEIRVFKSIYTVEKSSGEIVIEREPIKQLEARCG